MIYHQNINTRFDDDLVGQYGTQEDQENLVTCSNYFLLTSPSLPLLLPITSHPSCLFPHAFLSLQSPASKNEGSRGHWIRPHPPTTPPRLGSPRMGPRPPPQSPSKGHCPHPSPHLVTTGMSVVGGQCLSENSRIMLQVSTILSRAGLWPPHLQPSMASETMLTQSSVVLMRGESPLIGVGRAGR